MAENVEFEEINDAHNEAENKLCNTPQNPLEIELKMWMDVSERQQEQIKELQREIITMVKTLRPFMPLLEGRDQMPGLTDVMAIIPKIPALMNTDDWKNGTAVIQKYLPLIEF